MGNQFASLVNRHALFLTQLGQQGSIFLGLVEVQGVDDARLVNVVESPLLGFLKDMITVANKNDVGNVVGQYTVSSFQCALLLSLRQHDGLLVSLGTSHNLV